MGTDTTEQKRERLLTTVRDLVLEKGIQGSSMSKISRASGLPMGTIYAMYPTKEDLINAVYVFCRENYLGPISFPRVRRGEEYEPAFREAVFAYIDSAVAHDRDFLFVEQCYLDPIIRPETLSGGENGPAEVDMEGLVDRGGDGERSVFLVTHLILAVIHKAINLHLTGHITLDEATKEEVARICQSILRV